MHSSQLQAWNITGANKHNLGNIKDFTWLWLNILDTNLTSS